MSNDLASGAIIGRLGRDAELKYTTAGLAVANFAVAVNRSRKQEDGSYKDEATWWDCTLWGKQAEAINQYLTKGKQVGVSGDIYMRSYVNSQDIKVQVACCEAKSVQLLASPTTGTGSGSTVGGSPAREAPRSGTMGGLTPAEVEAALNARKAAAPRGSPKQESLLKDNPTDDFTDDFTDDIPF